MDFEPDRVADGEDDDLNQGNEADNPDNGQNLNTVEREDRAEELDQQNDTNETEDLPHINIRKRAWPCRDTSNTDNTSGVSSSSAISQESLGNGNTTNEPTCKRRLVVNNNDHGDGEGATAVVVGNSERSISPFVGFFSCVICQEVPHASIYQCRNGHLMCSACSIRFLAEHSMNNDRPRCPCCRVAISFSSLFRNLAVENALVVFTEQCPACNQQLERNYLEQHQAKDCIERSSICKYARVGCLWQGPYRELNEHEQNCELSKKTVADVMEALERNMSMLVAQTQPLICLKELINKSRCFFLDMESCLFYSDRHTQVACFSTRTFYAFGHQWSVMIRVHAQQQEPEQAQVQTVQTVQPPQAATTFKLQLKTRPLDTIRINFFILNGPYSTAKFHLQVYCYDFNFRRLDSDYFVLPLIDSQESYRILANRKINFRLFMFFKGAR